MTPAQGACPLSPKIYSPAGTYVERPKRTPYWQIPPNAQADLPPVGWKTRVYVGFCADSSKACPRLALGLGHLTAQH